MQTDIQRDRARSLRKNMPAAERKLWAHLRGRRLSGFKFNRQVEIGPYIVDFLCSEKLLIVEVDGVGHSDNVDVVYDKRRTAFLEAKGYKVYRCWNEDVYRNLEGVLEGVMAVLMERDSRFRNLAR